MAIRSVLGVTFGAVIRSDDVDVWVAHKQLPALIRALQDVAAGKAKRVEVAPTIAPAMDAPILDHPEG